MWTDRHELPPGFFRNGSPSTSSCLLLPLLRPIKHQQRAVPSKETIATPMIKAYGCGSDWSESRTSKANDEKLGEHGEDSSSFHEKHEDHISEPDEEDQPENGKLLKLLNYWYDNPKGCQIYQFKRI